MSNPIQQNPGNNYNNLPSGIIITAGAMGSGQTHTSTTIDTLNFNPQTGGLNGGAFAKGSLVLGVSGGHGCDILATVASSASITVSAATTQSVSSNIRIFNFPGFMSGEASGVAASGTLVSSYYVGQTGSGGVFCLSDFNNAAFVDLIFVAGAAFTPASGTSLQGWCLPSFDGGVTFEKSVAGTANPRAPDFVIPLYASAYAAGDQAVARQVDIPSEVFKVEFQNGANVTMPTTWGIWAAPTGYQLVT
jgi:hypothetical protein